MFRSKRSRTARASKSKDTDNQSIQDTVGQVIHNVDQVPDTMLDSSCNHSVTTNPTPAEPLETDTSYGVRTSQRSPFQVQDTGFHPKHGLTGGTLGCETQVGSSFDHWTNDPVGTEPMKATTTEANDVRPSQRNTAGRNSVAPSSSQILPTDSPRQFRPSKRQTIRLEEDDPKPVHGGLSAQPTKSAKWSDDIKFDETEEVEMRDSNGRHGKKGGKILPRHVWSLQPGVRFVVPFNALDQPVGKGGFVLVKFLGDIGKNGDLCPIGEVNWHKVDKSRKADIVALIREKFVIPPHLEIEKGILKHVGNRWRNYRHELKLQYKKPGKTEEQVASVVPKGVVPSQWSQLVRYWFSDHCQLLSSTGKKARAAQAHHHTTGSKSFARMRDEFEKKHGREPGAVEWFVQTHQRKDGTYAEDTSKVFLDTATAMISQHAPTSSSQSVAIENQVFNELMYSDEDDGFLRPVGYGFGVNKKKLYGVEGELRRRGYFRSGTFAEASSAPQSQKFGVKEEPRMSHYVGVDTSAEVERLSFAMEAMSETNELMQAQLKMQAKQLKMQSQQLQMQSDQMEALQSQLQQVNSLLTKFGVMLNHGPVRSAPRKVLRRGVDFPDMQVLEDTAESSDGESERSEWDSE